jgi:hypothetical protein
MLITATPRLDSFIVVLEYCGGSRTDHLVEQLRDWNPDRQIYVLDNASPTAISRHVTHRNQVNSFVGGGIIDCVKLASSAGYHLLSFITNDITCPTRLCFDRFERVFADQRVVQVSASITSDSRQAEPFPWMVRQNGDGLRFVPHADILATTIDLQFINEFGGFPFSQWGWGYSWELAYYAALRGRKIAVCDQTTIVHSDPAMTSAAWNLSKQKWLEHISVYKRKYGRVPWQGYRNKLMIGPWSVRTRPSPDSGLVPTGRRLSESSRLIENGAFEELVRSRHEAEGAAVDVDRLF